MATLPGISFGGVPVIRFSMLGDVSDLLQLQSGRKDEGAKRPSYRDAGTLWDVDLNLAEIIGFYRIPRCIIGFVIGFYPFYRI